MNLKLILFVSCVLVLVSGRRHHHNGGRDRHRHHRWHRHDPFVNFEVHEPKGLTVSIVQRSPNTTFFGLELYVNRNPRLSNDTHCDVCQNTTSITYGKFILEDDEAVIKKGDILYYYVLLGDSTNVTRLHLQKTWVTASIINRCNCETASEPPQIDLRFRQTTASPDFSSDRRPTFGVKPSAEEPQIPTDTPFNIDEHMNELNSEEYIPFECDLDPVTNQCRTARSDKLSQSNHDLEREVEILEAIVEQMRKTSCGSRSTTNMLRLESSNLPTNNLEQLTSVVQSSLAVNPEMKELAGGIRRIVPDRRSTSAVYFDMSSYVDKQKVLYHARMNNLQHISDYDSRHFGKSSRRG